MGGGIFAVAMEPAIACMGLVVAACRGGELQELVGGGGCLQRGWVVVALTVSWAAFQTRELPLVGAFPQSEGEEREAQTAERQREREGTKE